MFRRKQKDWLVVVAHQLARGGLALLTLAFAGAVWLVYDVVVGGAASWLASIGLFAFLALLWFVLPRARVTDER